MSAGKPIISVRELSKHFGPSVRAVDGVSLDVLEGEFFALLGPSGCGKTTLLRMLAGFETPTEGQILIDGRDMVGIEPNRRPVNMVFQSYAVFPHMTVAQNVGYGLRVTGVAKAEIGQRVAEALALVKLEGLQGRKPDQLSGGQRQRVSLARALVKQPRVLLLDEPLSALDAKLREAMQLELVRLQKSVGITFVIVTHDQDEALSMADRAAVMEEGQVRQIAPPAEIYEFPNCRFVADFIGKVNLFDADVVGTDGGRLVVEVAGIGEDGAPGQLVIDHDGPARGRIAVAVRPEKLRLGRGRPTEAGACFKGRVTDLAYYGNETRVYLDNPTGVPVTANLQNDVRRTEAAVRVGEELWIWWDAANTLVLTS